MQASVVFFLSIFTPTISHSPAKSEPASPCAALPAQHRHRHAPCPLLPPPPAQHCPFPFHPSPSHPPLAPSPLPPHSAHLSDSGSGRSRELVRIGGCRDGPRAGCHLDGAVPNCGGAVGPRQQALAQAAVLGRHRPHWSRLPPRPHRLDLRLCQPPRLLPPPWLGSHRASRPPRPRPRRARAGRSRRERHGTGEKLGAKVAAASRRRPGSLSDRRPDHDFRVRWMAPVPTADRGLGAGMSRRSPQRGG